ncbi:MAG: CPBP family glutamic-type intramembrane protease [Planctomycetota bacterium]
MHRLGEARRDPAVTLLALLPLVLIHLFGRAHTAVDSFFLVETTLQKMGGIGTAALWGFLVLGLLWALGRIRQLQLAWAGASAMILMEGLCWALLLGPGLSQLTQWLPLEPSPLIFQGAEADVASLSVVHHLAVAAGAGVYEELLFRGLGVGAGAFLLNFLFRHVAGEVTATRLSLLLAVLLSSAAFAMAHGWNGHAEAFQADVLGFRMLAGVAFGLLFLTRGLAVAVYAHFAYDALYLLT